MLTASDVMSTEVVTVTPETSIHDIATLLHTKHISGVPVVTADNTVIGIVSEGDLITHAEVVGEQRRSWWLRLFDDQSALAQVYVKTHGRAARDVMTSRVITVPPTATLAEVAKLLEDNRIKRVPVIRDGKLAGIITRGNLVQALATADVSKPASSDDRAIRTRLLKELSGQSWANLGLKSIVVQDGGVHLWGYVATEDERRALRLAAENVAGVKTVEDHLKRYHMPVAYE